MSGTIARHDRGMDNPPLVSVNARLASEELGLDVEIRPRQLGDDGWPWPS
jgi:hypothetical protein